MTHSVIPEWTLADHLRKARQTTGLSQRDFAASIDVKSSAYAQWEAGNSRPRDVVTIAKRIELLTGIPAAWTLDVTPWQSPDPRGGVVRPYGTATEPRTGNGTDNQAKSRRASRRPTGRAPGSPRNRAITAAYSDESCGWSNAA